jgi:hypothetical protein
MRASIDQVASPVRYSRAELSIWEQRVMSKRIFLIGALVGILMAHAVVLYKIDSGVRSSDITPVMASRSHKAFW